MHFTGYQRDGESGLDDANARYYGSALGRFTRPDPLGIASADPTNPQSLNEYAYVMNNPLNMIDPTGLDFEGDGGDGGDPGIGDGCDFCEAPPVGGPAQLGYHSSHTPFPVPGQGIDWLNWLFGPWCPTGSGGIPCATNFGNGPLGSCTYTNGKGEQSTDANVDADACEAKKGEFKRYLESVEQANVGFNACVSSGGLAANVTGLIKTVVDSKGKSPSGTDAAVNMASEDLDLQKDCLREHPTADLSPNYHGLFHAGDPGVYPTTLEEILSLFQ